MTLANPKSTPLFTSVDLKGWHRYSINKIIVAPTLRAAEARINTQIEVREAKGRGQSGILQKMWQRNYLHIRNRKPYVWVKHNTLLSTTLNIFNHGGGFILLWVCLSSARTREVFLG